MKITWSQINSYFALLEYNFTLKHNLSEERCTNFICDNIKRLNKKDYLPYYFLKKEQPIDFDLLNEMSEEFFVLIFQHYVTSLFYSEQGQIQINKYGAYDTKETHKYKHPRLWLLWHFILQQEGKLYDNM